LLGYSYFYRVKFVILIVVLVAATCSFGQLKGDLWIEAKGKAGFLAAHRSVMGHLATEHAFAGEVSCYFRPKNRKLWHKAYKNPLIGVTGFFGTVGNRELLGEYYGLIGFSSFPLINSKHYLFSLKMGAGLGYGTKHYNQESNQLSNAIGSSFNAQICLGLESRILFGNHSVNISIDMTHFSNGSSKMPNLGLNLPYVGLGYGYRIKKGIDSNYVNEAYKKRWEYGVMVVGSVKEIYPTGGKKYPIFAASAIGRRFFNPKVGMEVSFDLFSKQAIMGYHSGIRKKQSEIIQLGLFAGYILPLDHFHLLFGMGVYVRDKFKPETPLYHRIGMRYVFDNGININLALKSHWAKADYFEYGIGYTFKK
jgi:hypothetical protein